VVCQVALLMVVVKKHDLFGVLTKISNLIGHCGFWLMACVN